MNWERVDVLTDFYIWPFDLQCSSTGIWSYFVFF